MKKHTVHILIISTILAMVGAAYRFGRPAPRQPIERESTLAKVLSTVPKKEPSKPLQDIRAATPPPNPAPQQQPEPQTPPDIAEQTQELTPKQRRRRAYWQRVAQQFEQHEEMLNQENDPAMRMRIIQVMSRNVRVDTLRTLDWAMDLEDPAEQRAAMEAINQNALVGIGANIQTDETGLPKIMDTTILSAVASTGMVQLGDYISGIEAADGSIINFKNLPLRQIVQLLHGQPETEVKLIMERAPTEDQPEPYLFNVPVQRSMIIMAPSF